MDRVSIETTQNVRVDYEVASIGDRILAQLVDNLIFLGYFIILSAFAGFTRMFGGSALLGILLLCPVIFYHLVCEIFMDGRSVGKLVMKTKVVKLDGTQPSIGSYLLRWAFRILDTTLMYGAIATVTVIASGRGQRLGDMAAKTTVIKSKRKVALRDTILGQVDESYVPVFPQVANLTDKDIATIKEVLQLARIDQRWDLINQLAEKTKNVLQIQTSMPDIQFLDTIIRDYTNYNFS